MLIAGFAQASDTDAEIADDLYDGGMTAFRAGQFEKAITLWTQAYDTTPVENERRRSALSKDIAIAYRQIGDIEKAITYYERCLADWSGREYDSAVAIHKWILAAEKQIEERKYASGKRVGLAVVLVAAAVVTPIVTAIAFSSLRASRAAQ